MSEPRAGRTSGFTAETAGGAATTPSASSSSGSGGSRPGDARSRSTLTSTTTGRASRPRTPAGSPSASTEQGRDRLDGGESKTLKAFAVHGPKTLQPCPDRGPQPTRSLPATWPTRPTSRCWAGRHPPTSSARRAVLTGDGLARPQGLEHPVGDRLAGEPDLLAQERRLAVRDVAIGQANPDHAGP